MASSYRRIFYRSNKRNNNNSRNAMPAHLPSVTSKRRIFLSHSWNSPIKWITALNYHSSLNYGRNPMLKHHCPVMENFRSISFQNASLSLSRSSGFLKSRRSIPQSRSTGETSRYVSESFCRPGSNQSSFSPSPRLLHPYFDEIEAFEPAEHLLKEVDPQVRTKSSDEVRRLSDEFLSM